MTLAVPGIGVRDDNERMRDHVILCGLGRVGRSVRDSLLAAGIVVVAIDDRAEPADGPSPIVRGDFRDPATLERAGLAHARGVLVLASDDLANLTAVLAIIKARPGVRVVVRMFNPKLVQRLGVADVVPLSTSALAAPMLALLAHSGDARAAFATDVPMRIADWIAPGRTTHIGKPLSALATGALVRVLAHQPAGQTRRTLTDVPLDAPLAAGDALVVCGPESAVAALPREGDDEPLARLLKGETLRNSVRMVRRVVKEIDWPVKVCTLLLVLVIVTSVLIFRFGMRNDTAVDAFYRTISLMATGADMHGDEVDPGSWQKAYLSFLRLVGAALTAAFTAILTNYLVRAQLGGALEVRRIPEGGHVVLAGLGNVGIRVLEELVRLGERVVAVERSRDNPFIAAARRLGAAVVVGDASLGEVLRQANVDKAKSVLATTENELTNVEIALAVRENHPRKRVVVRLLDPRFAEGVRETAKLRYALSIPEAAAPAFVAALFGDRVRTLFLLDGRLVAVVELTIQPGDPLLGRPADEAAAAYRFVLAGPTPLAPLAVGDRVSAILAFADLVPLLRRDA